jgi:hypothetical protein
MNAMIQKELMAYYCAIHTYSIICSVTVDVLGQRWN